MASLKVRSRRDGAAIPLDEADKRLLNLMQGSFALTRRPFEHVAGLAGLTEDEVMERVQRLLDKRIIREITPIFDTRALGYQSMLVAAKVDAEHPHRAAKIINSHPGVTHNYLRNHDFNLWFTIAVEPSTRLGLQGTLDVLAAETGAQSIRQLPTLKLFKIRMDLEMEQGTDALAAAGEAVEPHELDPIELSDEDVATIRATQGPMPVVPEPYAPAAERLGVVAGRGPASGWSRCASAHGLRRVAAILYHRRAGFSANGMGVWKVPEDRDPGDRQADGRLPRHLALLPAARPTPTGRTRSSRWRTGARRRSATRSSTRSPRTTGISERATLYSSTEFKKVRMLYFTDDFRAVGGGAGLTTSLSDVRSAELYRRAAHVLPGGVNSPVRAMRSIGREPLFIERAEGAEIIDVDGNNYVDYVCSWGPLILGHAHPDVVEAVTDAAARGTTFGAPTAGEVELAELVCARMPAVDMLRMTSSGTEATMSALRLARAATGRDKVLKFAGAYHGHVDGLLADAGSGLATQGIPASPGVPEAAAAQTVVVPWNDEDALRKAFAEHELAAAICEPYAGQHGPRAAALRLPRAAARAVHRTTLLIFDEVITGFRIAPGGAQELTGVLPDLTVHGQGAGRRAAGGRLRRLRGADEPDRAGRRRLPGGHAERQSAGRGRGPRHARAARRGGLPDAVGDDRRRSPTGCARRPATGRCRSSTRPGC